MTNDTAANRTAAFSVDLCMGGPLFVFGFGFMGLLVL